MPRAKWKIFYADDTTLTAREVERPRDIPQAKRIGVHSIAQASEDGRVRDVCVGSAFYGWHRPTKQWMMMEQNDVDDYRANLPEELGIVLKGRVQPSEEYRRILVRARFDRDVIGEVYDPNMKE